VSPRASLKHCKEEKILTLPVQPLLWAQEYIPALYLTQADHIIHCVNYGSYNGYKWKRKVNEEKRLTAYMPGVWQSSIPRLHRSQCWVTVQLN
jgi:hypothetical protein